MTAEERRAAFEMRLDGAGWEAIAEALHYAPTTVYQDMMSCLKTPPRTPRIAYPALRRFTVEQCGGSITALAALSGLSRQTPRLRRQLTGRVALQPDVAAALLTATGLDAETAFRLDGEETP